MLHSINAHLIKDTQPNLPFKLHKFCLLTTGIFVYPYMDHDTDTKKKGGEVHLIKQQTQVKCLPHMSLYSKDDCRKIPGKSAPEWNQVCWRALWVLSLGGTIHRASWPAFYLHLMSCLLSQERGSKPGDHLEGWMFPIMSKRRWTGPFVNGQQAFFMDFQKYLYTTHPLSLKAAQTLSKGQLLPGVELWGDKRLRLVKFPLYLLWRWRDGIWDKEISRNIMSSCLRGMSF